jgi:hypothetical protein
MTWKEVEGSGIWVRAYAAGPAIANCLIVQLADGVAVVSPMSSPTDADFAAAEQIGPVVALVAPSTAHDLGQPAWQERYPEAGVYGPSQGLEKLNKLKLREFRPVSELACPDDMTMREAPATKSGSLWITSTRGARTVVFTDEIASNAIEPPSNLMFRFVFWLTSSGPGLTLNYVYSRIFVKDRSVIAKGMLEVLEGDPILVPAHGDLIATPEDLGKIRALLTTMAG